MTSCGDTPAPKKVKGVKDTVGCHKFYKCIEGKAYSCQNPKLFQSKCSAKYWNKGGKEKYRCQRKTRGGEDPCKE